MTWTALPGGSLSSDMDICLGETATLVFDLSGQAPFDVTYSDGTQQFVLQNIFDNHSISVSPLSTTTYSLVQVEGSSPVACLSVPGSTATVTVFESIAQNAAAEICEGESILLGGVMQSQAGIYFDTLSTISGCDSITITALVINVFDTTELANTSCDPVQTGVFTGIFTDQNGCDSTVITTITFSAVDSAFFSEATCDPDLTGILWKILPTNWAATAW